MTIGVLDLFRVGIGPSSSHTVGPMRAARRFLRELPVPLEALSSVSVELYGSLGATGVGHGTVDAVVLGLAGLEPESVEPRHKDATIRSIAESGQLRLLGRHPVSFSSLTNIQLVPGRSLPGHPNGMRFIADGTSVSDAIFYSVGGGFVASADELEKPLTDDSDDSLPYRYGNAQELLDQCRQNELTIASLTAANERARRAGGNVRDEILAIWSAMRDCIQRGCTTDGVLPGGLGVQRRAPAMRKSLARRPAGIDPLQALDWVNLWALAVNEENAAGGRVVTAPTNGAAGVIPAVLMYYRTFAQDASDSGVVNFLLAAGAIGALFKMNASISGAEVGCQGEIGSACAMAAAGLTQALGGSAAQVENAAEIALEHNLGLTCDPIAGLVQVPCIERNAMAATKAINASRIALSGDGTHLISLDMAIETLRKTGLDMHDNYKETARGGLALAFAERSQGAPIPVTVVEC